MFMSTVLVQSIRKTTLSSYLYEDKYQSIGSPTKSVLRSDGVTDRQTDSRSLALVLVGRSGPWLGGVSRDVVDSVATGVTGCVVCVQIANRRSVTPALLCVTGGRA